MVWGTRMKMTKIKRRRGGDTGEEMRERDPSAGREGAGRETHHR